MLRRSGLRSVNERQEHGIGSGESPEIARACKWGQPSGSKLDVHEAFILNTKTIRDISLAEMAERLHEHLATM